MNGEVFWSIAAGAAVFVALNVLGTGLMLRLRSRPDKLTRSMREVSHRGYLCVKPEELPHYAARLGYVLLPEAQYQVLIQAICTRTNIDGAVEDMLRKAGIIE